MVWDAAAAAARAAGPEPRQWPDPDHRCTALSSQAALVYVALFFSPDTLHREAATMREARTPPPACPARQLLPVRSR